MKRIPQSFAPEFPYNSPEFRGDVIRQLMDDRRVNNENLVFNLQVEIKLAEACQPQAGTPWQGHGGSQL